MRIAHQIYELKGLTQADYVQQKKQFTTCL